MSLIRGNAFTSTEDYCTRDRETKGEVQAKKLTIKPLSRTSNES